MLSGTFHVKSTRPLITQSLRLYQNQTNLKRNLNLGSDLVNGTLAVLFFLANGAGAMNSYCRELLSPQTGIAALTLTVMKGFKAKKDCFPHFLPISVYSAYSFIQHIRTSGGSRTRLRWFAVNRLSTLTITLCSLHQSSDKMSYLNQMYEKGIVSIREEKKIPQMFHSPSHFVKSKQNKTCFKKIESVVAELQHF